MNRTRGRKLQKRRALHFAQFPLCEHCQAKGRLTVATELDHIIPLDKGGADNDPANWQGLCSDCHKAKTAKDMGYKEKHQIGADGWPVGAGNKLSSS